MNKSFSLPTLPVITKKEPNPADLLLKALLDEFETAAGCKAAKEFFGALHALKARADIPLSPGRRWNKKKADDYKCHDIIVAIAVAFNRAMKEMNEGEKKMFKDILVQEFVMVGNKGKDGFRRTLYCLYTPKGSIPLDQPLGDANALLRRKNKR